MILLAFIPTLYPATPLLVDLPGHMARYHVELNFLESPELQRFFAFKWQLIGNLGVDILVIPMAKIFGLELAVKLVAMAVPPMTVAGFLWVAREVHNRLPPTAAFALPFAFSQPYQWGFLNYALSMALAFIAFGLWLRLGRLGRLRLRFILFVPISFLLFICHVFGWGTLGLLAFSAEAVRQHDKGKRWLVAGTRSALHAAGMAGPLILMLMWRNQTGESVTDDWFNWNLKSRWMLTALRDHFAPIDIGMIGVCGFLLLATTRDDRLAYSRNLTFSSLVLLACFLLLPRIVFGSNYADMRLIPFVFATFLLSIRYRRETDTRIAGRLAVMATSFWVMKVALTTYSLGISWLAAATDLQAIDRLPRGAAIVTLVGEPCHPPWALHRKSHIGSFATVRHDSFTNDQWAIDGANLLTVIYREAGAFANDPSQMVRPNGCGNGERLEIDKALGLIPRDSISYVWLVDAPPHDPKVFAGYHLERKVGESELYARDKQATPVGWGIKYQSSISGANEP